MLLYAGGRSGSGAGSGDDALHAGDKSRPVADVVGQWATWIKSSIGKVLGGSNSTVAANNGSSEGDDDVIHVFSLASGHLYERFLKVRKKSGAGL